MFAVSSGKITFFDKIRCVVGFEKVRTGLLIILRWFISDRFRGVFFFRRIGSVFFRMLYGNFGFVLFICRVCSIFIYFVQPYILLFRFCSFFGAFCVIWPPFVESVFIWFLALLLRKTAFHWTALFLTIIFKIYRLCVQFNIPLKQKELKRIGKGFQMRQKRIGKILFLWKL